MGLFNFGNSKKIADLENENTSLRERISDLEYLCEEKDEYFKEMISDGLRHGSSLAGKHMADRKKDSDF
ncbi:hypothetical protein [Streptococcus sp. FT1-106]|uniref:hypothetical protein n=1 Tax=unclassified Streptococcus TaxID=2608887 RepID=UPI003BF4AC63